MMKRQDSASARQAVSNGAVDRAVEQNAEGGRGGFSLGGFLKWRIPRSQWVSNMVSIRITWYNMVIHDDWMGGIPILGNFHAREHI